MTVLSNIITPSNVLTTTNTATVTNKTFGDNPTFSGGTANGVTYLNGSKVLTSGSALTFDGTTATTPRLALGGTTLPSAGTATLFSRTSDNNTYLQTGSGNTFLVLDGSQNSMFTASPTVLQFLISNSEQMRLTSTGLGIGTSSPAYKLDVNGTIAVPNLFDNSGSVRFKYSAVNAASRDWRIVSDIANYGDFGIQQSTTQGGSTFDTKLMFSSTGNLGLGVTPSAWASGNKALQVGSLSALWQTSGYSILSNNVYQDSGGNKYLTTTGAGEYAQFNGSHLWFTAPSGTAGNAISFTQAMTLDASGNLLVGSTSVPSPVSNYKSFVVGGTTGGIVDIGTTSTSYGRVSADSVGLNLESLGATTTIFRTNSTERARIDSSGNLLVGTTSQISASKLYIKGALSTVENGIGIETSQTGTSYYLAFYNSSSSLVGSISANGTTTSYNVTSDQRLKENIQDAESASSLIDSLQVRKFDWKADGSHQRYGFVAQELVTVYPEAVHQPIDTEDMMAVDYSKLVPLLVKEIQSLKARLDAANL
jgi:hypothetical protein